MLWKISFDKTEHTVEQITEGRWKAWREKTRTGHERKLAVCVFETHHAESKSSYSCHQIGWKVLRSIDFRNIYGICTTLHVHWLWCFKIIWQGNRWLNKMYVFIHSFNHILEAEKIIQGNFYQGFGLHLKSIHLPSLTASISWSNKKKKKTKHLGPRCIFL